MRVNATAPTAAVTTITPATIAILLRFVGWLLCFIALISIHPNLWSVLLPQAPLVHREYAQIPL